MSEIQITMGTASISLTARRKPVSTGRIEATVTSVDFVADDLLNACACAFAMIYGSPSPIGDKIQSLLQQVREELRGQT